MIEATLALSRSLGSIDSTVGSTTDKAWRASWYFVKDYPLGEFIGSLWGVHVYAIRFHCRFHDRQSFAGLLVLRQGLSPWGVHWESMGSSRVRQGFREK